MTVVPRFGNSCTSLPKRFDARMELNPVTARKLVRINAHLPGIERYRDATAAHARGCATCCGT
ncbi:MULTISPECIES: hypothetical protein [unclassified Xanthobacter]|uniref:hypothetical protein n=1 Tax=unclassified Xanthobacter TaxID=2623496 RepID=UPI001EDF7969|nr:MULTISPECIES: hypothetical protein [unclassified Xanthobacter]